VVLAPNSKQDAALEKRSSSDARAQMLDPKIITVQLGDTLSKIIIREYGKYDRSTLDSVLKANPDILDISLIEVGRRITLPRPPQMTTNN
jgi:phage tail protein X